VSYLRALHEPARQRCYPGRPPAELFPLLTLDQLHAVGAEQRRTLAIEIGREAATIIMIAAVALAVSRNAGESAAAFVIIFGTWDTTDAGIRRDDRGRGCGTCSRPKGSASRSRAES
jgi:hypothetical protein